MTLPRSLPAISGAAWWAALAALLTSHLIVGWQSLTVSRFWEDEAYNLTVPLNLLRGLGYSSDGMLSGWVLEGSVITPFDVRISTGPAVLVPAALLLQLVALFGIEPTGQAAVITARLVPLAYWGLLIAGLGVLGRRIGGRWASLVAMGVPLAFTAAASNSPLQGPADLLGEVATAALVVWAFIALRRRPWLAGLIFGLAVQAKYIALLAAPALVVACLILAARPLREWWGVLWRPILFTLIPTAVYELFALATLGLRGYGIHIVYTGGFLFGGGQPSQGTTIAQKLDALASAWFVPATAAWVTAILVLALIATAVLLARRDPALLDTPARLGKTAGSAPPRELAALLAASTLGSLAFIGWWAAAAHTPIWVRHPAPGIYAFLPLLAAFAVLGVDVVAQRMTQHPRGSIDADRPATTPRAALPIRPVAAAVLLALIAIVGYGAAAQLRLGFEERWQTLAEQQVAASGIRTALDRGAIAPEGWVAAEPWGPSVSIGVMTGYHTGIAGDPAMNGAPRITDGACAAPIIEVPGYLLCAPE